MAPNEFFSKLVSPGSFFRREIDFFRSLTPARPLEPASQRPVTAITDIVTALSNNEKQIRKFKAAPEAARPDTLVAL